MLHVNRPLLSDPFYPDYVGTVWRHTEYVTTKFFPKHSALVYWKWAQSCMFLAQKEMWYSIYYSMLQMTESPKPEHSTSLEIEKSLRHGGCEACSVVKHLPYKRGNLSLISRTQVKSQAPCCVPVILALELRRYIYLQGSLACQPRLLGGLQTNEGPCLKKQDGGTWLTTLGIGSGLHRQCIHKHVPPAPKEKALRRDHSSSFAFKHPSPPVFSAKEA